MPTHTGGLASGQSYTQQATFNVPAGLTGNYYVMVVANSGDTVFENGVCQRHRCLGAADGHLADAAGRPGRRHDHDPGQRRRRART